MVKHKMVNVFGHFVGLALQGLKHFISTFRPYQTSLMKCFSIIFVLSFYIWTISAKSSIIAVSEGHKYALAPITFTPGPKRILSPCHFELSKNYMESSKNPFLHFLEVSEKVMSIFELPPSFCRWYPLTTVGQMFHERRN